MKLVEHNHKGNTLSFVCFSAEEEYAMAKWVMDVLCLPWIDTKPEFHKFMEQTFWRKCRGKDLTVEQTERMCDYNERYSDLLPPFPRLKNNGKRLQAPEKHKDGIELNIAEKIEFIEWSIRNAWKEIWEGHEGIRTKTRFGIFPGEKPTDEWIAKQTAMEEAFWAEVEVKQFEYGCSRKEAIVAVVDYMPRPEEQYRIPNPTD